MAMSGKQENARGYSKRHRASVKPWEYGLHPAPVESYEPQLTTPMELFEPEGSSQGARKQPAAPEGHWDDQQRTAEREAAGGITSDAVAELLIQYELGQFGPRIRKRLAEIFRENPTDAIERLKQAAAFVKIDGQSLDVWAVQADTLGERPEKQGF